MKNVIGENNVVLQADGKLLVRHHVGFIQINKTRLLIYPKISKRMTGEDEFEKSFKVLMRLLSYSGFEGVKNIPTPQSMDKYNGDLLELFIGLFVDELLLQFKRDINRGYNHQLENQTFIKGKVDFVETVKKNSFKKHLHYVRYDQFSENILLNRVFKSVIQNLISRTNSKRNKIKLKQSLLWLEDVEEMVLNNEIWKNIKFTRHNLKYTPAFNMAKLFYYNSSPNLNAGDEYIFSFLVPVNQLFEMYLYKVLKEHGMLSFKCSR
jgi:5-methylcytosine-specific restriction enzyme subunit McrC